jgi:hypothetical protein
MLALSRLNRKNETFFAVWRGMLKEGARSLTGSSLFGKLRKRAFEFSCPEKRETIHFGVNPGTQWSLGPLLRNVLLVKVFGLKKRGQLGGLSAGYG